MSTFSVHLVTWNGAKYLPYLFDSLRKQTLKDWELFILDNNSPDNTVEILQKEIQNFPVPCNLTINKNNLGFAGGHNQIYKKTDSDYFLLLNQDIYLAPDCLEKLKLFLDEHQEVAATSPRLMKWNFAEITQLGLEKSLSNTVDAIGLKIFRNRRVIEWQTARDWRMGNSPIVDDLMNKTEVEVFGVSGACPVFRRSAINQVAFADGAMFDESYHSYKEDVDLAYRLKSSGFQAAVLPGAVAYHDRAGAGPGEMGDSAALKNKKNQPERVRYYSYKNHLKTLFKNEYGENLILDFPFILWYELKKFVYFLLFEKRVLGGLSELWKERRELLAKRRYIKKLRKISWKEMREEWNK